MPQTISNEAFAIPLVLAALLYVLGFWAQLAFPRAVAQYGRLAVNPILGLISVTTLLTTASYLGYSIPEAAICVLLVHAPFSVWGASRAISGKRERRWDSLWMGGAIAFVMVVFLWPYAKDRAFFVFGDSYTYMTIADYLNTYSYRVIPQDAVQYPWKNQTFVYLAGHYRMGAQVFLAFSSSLFGVTTDRAYMPVTALMLAISFMTLSGFLRSMTASIAATLAALSLYFTNVYYIYEPAIINFLPQIPGISCTMLLFAVPADRAPRSDAILRGVAGAGILLFYPEIAIFAVCGVALSFGLSVYRRRVPVRKALESLAVTLGVAVLINPITAYYAVYSLLLHTKSRSGFDVVLPAAKLLRSIVGYQDPIVSSSVITALGFVLGMLALALLVWGVSRMEAANRDRWAGVSFCFAATGLYTLLIANYSYATYKTLSYSYFLTATAIGFGWSDVWRRFSGNRVALACVAGLAVIWAAGVSSPVHRYLTSHYNMAGQSIYDHPKGFRGFAQDYEDLAGLAKFPAADEETLVLIPAGPVERWATFFYRAPVSLYFHAQLPLIRPLVIPRRFNQKYVLGEAASTAVKNPKAAIFTNSRFVFSKAQPAISLTNSGWYPEEIVRGESRRWMAQRAELVAWMPAADKIRLQANVSNPAFPQTKTIAIYVDGKQAGERKLTAANSLFDSGELELPAGFHTILFTVAEKPVLPPTADTRELVLYWGRIRFSEPTPTEILLSDARTDPRVRGLTLDRWMTDKPVEFTLGLPTAPRKSLRILGDIPGLDPLFPQTVIASFPGGTKGSAMVTKPGEFDIEIPIPAGVSGDVSISLSALKTVSPASLSANPDNRPLALRFHGVMIK